MSKGASDTPVPHKPGVLQVLWTAIIILAATLYLVLLLDLPSFPGSGNTHVLNTPITSEPGARIGLAKKPSTESGLFAIEGIYVITLESRQDRYGQMDILSSRLNLHWEWVSAVTATDRMVNATLNWVREARNKAAMSTSEEEKDTSGALDALPTFIWPADIDSLAASDEYLDYWDPSDSPDLDDGSSSSQNSPDDLLPVTTQDYVLPVSTNDTAAPLQEYMLLTPGRIACWHSHLNLIHRVANSDAIRRPGNSDIIGEDTSSSASSSPKPVSVEAVATQRAAWLILEDDVDMERDTNAQLSRLWKYLPDDWDIVFLGHCWSNESFYPAIPDNEDPPPSRRSLYKFSRESSTPPNVHQLHPSYAPKCTHAYVLSILGARRLLLHLRYPPFAYSRAIDQAIAWLVKTGRLRSYSVVPSLVVQRKIGKSDVWGGDASGGESNGNIGSGWRERLRNGVFNEEDDE